ncbi:MAG: methyl-accepting chemotaxis protein, partial [Gemmatimonadota bacterium]|nr:methyl-accepting chemotaxis protein [Gemmatimonadota bacterium]
MAATTRLRSAILGIAIPATILLIGAGAVIAIRYTGSEIERVVADALAASARRGAVDVSAFMSARRRELRSLATAPSIIAAAREAGREARRLGLARLDPDDLEDRFAERRLLAPDPALRRFLQTVRDSAEFADLALTEASGFGVTAAGEPLRFGYADETWWQEAMASGIHVGSAQFDEVARAAAIDLAVRVDDPTGGPPLGVLRGAVRLAAARLSVDDELAAVAEIIDPTGRVLVTRDSTRILRPSPIAPYLPDDLRATMVRVPLEGGDAWVVLLVPDFAGRWWSVVRAPESVAFHGAHVVRLIIGGTAGTVLLMIVLGLWWVADWLDRRISVPLDEAAGVAQRVAGGDLTVEVRDEAGGSGEVALLLDGLRTMVTELRGVVTGIRSSAEELAAMAQQISASTEEMSASTEEMASTSQRLTDQAADQATQVKGAATDAERILAIATQLADGATVAAGRSAELRETAEGHRGRLVAGSERLAQLAQEVERGAHEAETLASLSAEIQQFVGQAKTIA